eukprot:COSAG06_NODE_25179_length_643_cov_0.685662_2_plen_54_part_01
MAEFEDGDIGETALSFQGTKKKRKKHKKEKKEKKRLRLAAGGGADKPPVSLVLK